MLEERTAYIIAAYYVVERHLPHRHSLLKSFDNNVGSIIDTIGGFRHMDTSMVDPEKHFENRVHHIRQQENNHDGNSTYEISNLVK